MKPDTWLGTQRVGARLQQPWVRKLLLAGIPLLVVGLMGVLIWRNFASIVAFPWRLHAGYIGLALLFHSLALWVTFWVWHLMLRALGNFGQLAANLRFYYVSTLAKRLPTGLPYVGGRLFLYKQMRVSGAAVLNCIFLENLLIGTAGVLFFVALLPIYTMPVAPWVRLGLVGLGIGLVAALLLRSGFAVEFTNWVLGRLGKTGLDRAPTRREMFTWIGLYVLPWPLAALSLYYAARGFSTSIAISIPDAMMISTLATLVTLLNFIIPAGLGLKEITLAALLAPWMPLPTAIVFSLIYRLLHTLNDIVWALLALLIPVSAPVPVPGENTHTSTPELGDERR
ncbi:MAG: lysylphosphatidylglycerol synthase domain-containing protein [Litorilinea sp.]